MHRYLRTTLLTLKNAILFVLSFEAILAGGLFLTLIVVAAIGYLPYSDRPGPGWMGSHSPTLQELGFFGSWVFFFVAPFVEYWGGLLFVYTRFLGWLGTPKWLVRILGSFLAVPVSFIITLSAGWYIAVSSVIVYAGAILGFIFSAWLLPRFVGAQSQRVRNVWLRVTIVVSATILISGVLVYPLIPDRNAQTLEYEVMRLEPSSQKITAANTSLKPNELKLLELLGVTGDPHFGVSSYSGGGEKHARALIILTGPLHSDVELRQPKATNIVYIQHGDNWQMYPRDAPTLSKKIKLMPSSKQDGLAVAEDTGVGGTHRFTWYPPIKR